MAIDCAAERARRMGRRGIHSAQELIADAFLLNLCHGSKQGEERRRLLFACNCAFYIAFNGALV